MSSSKTTGQPPEPIAGDTAPEQGPPAKEGGMGLTIAFLILLAALYLLTSYPDFERIHKWALGFGGFAPQGIADDQWWRWITANLLHANLMHLLMNAFAIYIFGRILEPPLGRMRYLGLLVAGGIGCDIATFFFSDSMSIGASGIAYALIGFYFMLVLTVTRRVAPQLFSGQVRSVVFVIILYVVSDIMRPNINMWGHLGGLAAGVLYGLALLGARRNPPAETA